MVQTGFVLNTQLGLLFSFGYFSVVKIILPLTTPRHHWEYWELELSLPAMRDSRVHSSFLELINYVMKGRFILPPSFQPPLSPILANLAFWITGGKWKVFSSLSCLCDSNHRMKPDSKTSADQAKTVCSACAFSARISFKY